jgi:hypothetical protein
MELDGQSPRALSFYRMYHFPLGCADAAEERTRRALGAWGAKHKSAFSDAGRQLIGLEGAVSDAGAK